MAQVLHLHQVKRANKEVEEEEDDAPTFGGLIKARRKTPVKDGVSQQAFMMKNLKSKGIVDNPNKIYYTPEEVAKHRKAHD